MTNEPVRQKNLIAGVLVAVGTTLGILAVADPITIQSGLLAASVGLLELATVLGAGELARNDAYGPQTVDRDYVPIRNVETVGDSEIV